MEVLSAAWRTDLALLADAGSRVEHHPTHVVVRTPGNPAYRWGNFVLLRRTPLRRDVAGWLDRFADLVPGVPHQAFGVDDPDARPEDLSPLADAGFRVTASLALTAQRLLPPQRPLRGAEVRLLASDADWDQRVELAVACNTTEPAGSFRRFAERQAATERRLAVRGSGGWFGVFDGPRMLSGLGIFRAGDGLARYQNVETHPEARGRGLATTLVHAAGTHALRALGAATLVIVADPGYHAIRIYRALGFAGTERQLQAERTLRPDR